MSGLDPDFNQLPEVIDRKREINMVSMMVRDTQVHNQSSDQLEAVEKVDIH